MGYECNPDQVDNNSCVETEEKEAEDNVGHQCIRNKMFLLCCVLLFSGTAISGRLQFFFR